VMCLYITAAQCCLYNSASKY